MSDRSMSDKVPEEENEANENKGKRRRVEVDENEMENLEDEEDSVYNIIMSVVFHKGRLGIVTFDSSTGEMEWGEINETPSLKVLEFLTDTQVKYRVQPTLIIAPSKSDSSVIEALKKEGERKVELKLLKQQDFSLHSAKQNLFLLKNILNEGDSSSDLNLGNEYLGELIGENENTQMIRAAGGLLKLMQQDRIQFGELDQVDVLKTIKTITHITFEGFMQLDINAIRSLAIFKVENHPCNSMKIGVAKEGLSLFGILNKCKSSVGKDLMRQWFLQPLMDVNTLNERFDSVQFFSSVEGKDLIPDITGSLKHIKNTRKILKRMRESKAIVTDWLNLYKTLFCFKEIYETFLGEIAESLSPSITSKLKGSHMKDCYEALKMMSRFIDFRESKSSSRVVILPGVNEELDQIKSTYESLDDILTIVAEKQMDEYPDDFPYEMSVVYFPQIGYLIVIPKSEDIEKDQGLERYGLEFHFMSSEFAYYKNEKMRELDESLGDLHGIIVDMEDNMAREVEDLVLQKGDSIVQITDLMAEIDCLLSFAVCASEYNYVRPQIVPDNILRIVEGRNPIQEMCVATFIPNSTDIAERMYSNLFCWVINSKAVEDGRVHIITGPNNSGKTIYLRQVGLICFMAHIGSFVPASEAIIGLTDKIMTRISSLDSVSVNHSTFAADLMQMNSMFNSATSSSLLLIDEFGKGTLAFDGIALLSSSVNHFTKMKSQCPKIFVSTHYTEVVDYKLLDLSQGAVQYWTMDTVLNTIESKSNYEWEIGDELVFLYKLVPGKRCQSYGVHCASVAGIPEEILVRALDITGKLANDEPVERLRTGSSIEEEKKCKAILECFSKLDCGKEEEVIKFMQFLRLLGNDSSTGGNQ